MASSVRFVENPAGIAATMRGPEVTAAVRDGAERILEYAQSIAPVLTGNYRDELHIEEVPGAAGTEFRVISTVEYAMSIEANDGTLARSLDAG